MRGYFVATVSLAGVIAGAAACSPIDSREFTPVHGQGIVNGQLEEGFPSTVALGGNFGDGPTSMCTGNLITPRVLISAAHCGDGIPIGIIQALGVAFFGASIDDPDAEIGFDSMQSLQKKTQRLLAQAG